MAARFGCTIVPVSTVGEDDIIDVCSLPDAILGSISYFPIRLEQHAPNK